MFQPQPTPFANFFPAYLPVGVGVGVGVDDLELELDLGRRDDGFQQGHLRSESYVHAQAHAAGFSSHAHHHQQQQQQVHQLMPFVHQGVVAAEACRLAGVGNPCPGPVGPVPGSASFTRCTSCYRHSGISGSGLSSGPAAPPAPGGLGHGGAAAAAAVAVAGAPLSTFFPLHGAIPHSRLDLDLEPAASRSNNLFDHHISSFNTTNLQHPSRHHFRLTFPRRATSRSTASMEPDQSLQDELAAQEAAARVWQPDINVRSTPPPQFSTLNSPFDGLRQRSFSVHPALRMPRLAS